MSTPNNRPSSASPSAPAATPAAAPSPTPSKPPSPGATPSSVPISGAAHTLTLTPDQVVTLRDVFWHNVIRDMLNGLAVLSQRQPELFDGRFAILTHAGERIPIAAITPVFAMTAASSPADMQASLAVQCTIFRVQTPGGEVFTLPVQEIRGLHSMTPELVEQLQHAAEDDQREDNDDLPEERHPFGLAAFTALPKPPAGPAPDQPTE